MSNYESILQNMNLSIPNPPPVVGNFLLAVKVGNLVYCSGQGPYQNGSNIYIGQVGTEISIDEAYHAAQIACLNCLASISSVIGSINNINRIIQVRGFVNSNSSFHQQPKVIDGASNLLIEIFGENGRHARCAIGTNNLPNNIPVEVEMIIETLV
jgi:enamine deaminase RidA (YjgF/YER057c/UK114 family)